jgi:Protein of unknown function (DUF3040)
MPEGRPDEPCLSVAERQLLEHLEGRLIAEDPGLDHTLRTGRRMPRRVDPVQAGIAVTVAAPLMLLILWVCGPAVGAFASAIAVIALPGWLLLCRRFSSPGPTGYR